MLIESKSDFATAANPASWVRNTVMSLMSGSGSTFISLTIQPRLHAKQFPHRAYLSSLDVHAGVNFVFSVGRPRAVRKALCPKARGAADTEVNSSREQGLQRSEPLRRSAR